MRNKYNQLQKHIRRDGFSANPELANMIDNMLQHGFALDSAGQIEQAKSIYEAILKLNPKHFHALQLLGAIAVQTQQWDKALKLLTDALAINNTSASVYNNRGIVGCCWFQRHFVKVLNETGGCLWIREGNSAGSSSSRR